MSKLTTMTLRISAPVKAYYEARADQNGRSLNAELVVSLGVIMRAEPLVLELTEANGFYLLGSKDDPVAHGAFNTHADAVGMATKITSALPPFAVAIADHTAPSV